MDAWEELNGKFSAGPVTKKTETGWDTLARQHAVPVASTITSQVPDNTQRGQALQRAALEMSGGQRALASIGSGMSDVVMAAKQMFGKATAKDADEKRVYDEALNSSPLNAALKFAGSVAPTMAVPFGAAGRVVSKVAPKIAPIVDGSVQGAMFGALQPVGTGESRLFNTLSSGAMGTVLPGIAAAYRSGAGNVSPVAAGLAQTAIDKYKIPLLASDMTDSRFAKSLNSLYGDLPITGGIANARKDAQQVAFNRAVGNTFGAADDRLTPEAVQRAHSAMTKTFGDIYSRNPADAFKVDASLQPILAQVGREGTESQTKIINARLQDLYSKIDQNTGTIDGQFFNRWQSELGKTAGNDDLVNGFRKAALRGYNESVSGADADLLSATKAQYRNWKTVNPLIDKAPTGDISPALLSGRVASNFSDFSRGGGGDLGELARVGSQFMVDRTRQTGGSARALLQNSAIASGLTLPIVAPLNAAMNSNFARDVMMRKALSQPGAQRGFIDGGVQPMGLLGEMGERGAAQALPAMGLGGLLSF